jgi:transposase
MGKTGLLSMSESERERASIMRMADAKAITQREAAERLGLSVRQVKRLYRAWKAGGDAELVSGHRGRVSPRRMGEETLLKIESLLRNTYPDFGATMASEKLAQLHGIVVSREKVRQIQVVLGLAMPKRRKAGRVHQPRERRPRMGELIQIDGSPHDWFEGRGPKCTLIVFIDDATSRLMSLRFSPTETTASYLEALRAHVLAHGRPLAFYSDRHGIFRVNAKEAASGDGKTEFGRVAERLKIEPIHAKTPQAKGRVERANQTLQDRLIKEMRLRGISSMAEGQAYADAFMATWNGKFACPPRDVEDAHRPWTTGEAALDEDLARRDTRTLSKALTFSVGGRIFSVEAREPRLALRGAKVTLLHFLNGDMRVFYRTRELRYTHVRTVGSPSAIEDEKTINARMDDIATRAA